MSQREPATNYFKLVVEKQSFVWSFITNDRDDTQRAYELATFAGRQSPDGELSIYSIPRCNGPWDRLPVIGFRKRGQILADLSNESLDTEEHAVLLAELDQLDRVYLDAGRNVPPTQLVAA